MIIRIKNLRLRAIIGVNAWERVDKQPVIVNAEVTFDGTAASISDDLKDTIDYSSISQRLANYVESSKCQLIEALAGNLLKLILEDQRITFARVEVDKPNALPSSDSTSVEVTGGRA